MHALILALPLALLTLPTAMADDGTQAHGSLDKHQHGAAMLNVALEGNALEIELESPTINLFGFEHAPASPADQAKVAAARTALENPLALFDIPAAAGCSVHKVDVETPLYAEADDQDDYYQDAAADTHSDIEAEYDFTCSQPQALTSLGLAPLFKQFPAIQKIDVQLIGPKGQKGELLSAAKSAIDF